MFLLLFASYSLYTSFFASSVPSASPAGDTAGTAFRERGGPRSVSPQEDAAGIERQAQQGFSELCIERSFARGDR